MFSWQAIVFGMPKAPLFQQRRANEKVLHWPKINIHVVAQRQVFVIKMNINQFSCLYDILSTCAVFSDLDVYTDTEL